MLIACGLGILAGALVGGLAVLRNLLLPIFSSLYAVPIVILYPIFTAWFGIGSSSKIAFAGIYGFFPVMLSTAAGIRTIDPQFLLAARSMGATLPQQITRVIIPASLPTVFAGLRLGGALDHHRRRGLGDADLFGRHRLPGDAQPHHSRQPAGVCRHPGDSRAVHRLLHAGARAREPHAGVADRRPRADIVFPANWRPPFRRLLPPEPLAHVTRRLVLGYTAWHLCRLHRHPLSEPHDPAAPRDQAQPTHGLGVGCRRLRQRARRHRAAARLFRRVAAGAVGRDAARVDGRQRRRPRHHRPAVAGRPALHLKFIWAPVVDAWQVPWLSARLGRRRGWLVASQLVLMAAIVFLGTRDPVDAPLDGRARRALVAFASATQDIVIDAYRVQSLPVDEQAAGMAGYVAAYRIGMLASGAGVIGFTRVAGDAGLEQGRRVADRLCRRRAAGAGRARRAVLSAREPQSRPSHEAAAGREPDALTRVFDDGARAPSPNSCRAMPRSAMLLFVVLFKLCDALAGAMTAPFVLVARLRQGDLRGDRQRAWASPRC